MADPNYLGYAQASIAQDPFERMARGYGIVQGFQNQQALASLRNMEVQKMAQEQAALKGYAQTKDINQLLLANPAAGSRIMEAQTHQRKADIDALKPGLDYLYMNKDALKDPTQYSTIRANALKISPMLGAHLPEQFNPDTTPQLIDQGAASYEKMKKLEKTLSPYEAGKLSSFQERNAIMRGKAETEAQYKQRLLELRDREVSTKEFGTQSKMGEKPRFIDFVKDPEIAKLPYPEQVKRFNLSVSEGKEAGKGAKPLTPLQAAKLKEMEATTDLINKLSKGKGGATATPPPPANPIVHTSDHELTPEEAAALLKQMGQ